jgi:uncharacterized protein (DUF3084 family)
MLRRKGQQPPEASVGAGRFSACALQVLLLTKEDLAGLVAERPELEADLRAAVAQRKAELMRLETLERIAGSRGAIERELRCVADSQQHAGGRVRRAERNAQSRFGSDT